jgi:hypothetical protein
MRNYISLFLLVTLGLLLGGCASTTTSSSMQPMSAVAQVCEDPRPQSCTMDYRPVCGTSAGGVLTTYSNGCGACANAAVTSWTEGACP